jgi:hypothetical protein
VKDVHIAIGGLALLLAAAAALWGTWCWWRADPNVWFWRILRGAQAMIVIEALIGCILLIIGKKVSDLHLLYGALPIAVSFFGEQFRISAAQMILDARQLENGEAVGKLPAAEQRAIVLAIIKREIGVMTLTAFVITVLVIRAAMVH